MVRSGEAGATSGSVVSSRSSSRLSYEIFLPAGGDNTPRGMECLEGPAVSPGKALNVSISGPRGGSRGGSRGQSLSGGGDPSVSARAEDGAAEPRHKVGLLSRLKMSFKNQ